MAQCQSPEELMKLISRIVDAMVNQYLLCGTLQGGLVACGEDAYLPKDTEVVLCRQLYELVQDGIDTGKIVAPTVVEVRYEGSTLILHLANGENLTLDLKPLIDGVIDKAFIDCDGQPIHVGTALATCANLEAVKLALETKLADLNQKVDHNKELTDQADTALNQRIDDWITDTTERMTLLDESITNKIDAATAEWANTVLQQLIEQFLETRQVYHDESLDGDGHEAAPLKVDVTWLRNQIAAYLPEVVKFTDCCGNDIAIGDVLVTCECLDQQLTLLTNELKAYAESEDAKVLIAANNYTDEKAAETLQQANSYTDDKAAGTLQQANDYTDEQISSIGGVPYLRSALDNGDEPLVAVDGLALGYDTEASDENTTAIGHAAKATGYNSTAIGQDAKASGTRATVVGAEATASSTYATAFGGNTMASGYGATAIGHAANATDMDATALGRSAAALGNCATALGYAANASDSQTVALGYAASADYMGATALGSYASVTGAYQVQLGNSSATTYAYGAVQDRSDKRDKTDVHNSDLGLEFIQKLRPVKFRWDYRDDYINELFPKPKREDFIEASVVNEAAYAQALQAYQAECTAFMQNPDERKDGSKARQRYHYGLIADELKGTLDELGVVFGGYQDHSINGGMCVKSVGYAELISPLIKAVQELSAQVDDLKQQLEGK